MHKNSKRHKDDFNRFVQKVLTPLDPCWFQEQQTSRGASDQNNMNVWQMEQQKQWNSHKQMEQSMKHYEQKGSQIDGLYGPQEFNPTAPLISMSEQQRQEWRKRRAQEERKDAQAVYTSGSYNFSKALEHARKWGLVS